MVAYGLVHRIITFLLMAGKYCFTGENMDNNKDIDKGRALPASKNIKKLQS
jgi:hypothetical protein